MISNIEFFVNKDFTQKDACDEIAWYIQLGYSDSTLLYGLGDECTHMTVLLSGKC